LAVSVPHSRFTSLVPRGSALTLGHFSIMKKFIFTTAVALLTCQLPAAIILAMSSLGDGRCHIIAPGNSTAGPVYCVLQSTSDFVTWTSISTNMFPWYGQGYGVTNIIQVTNVMEFYRVKAQH
jgi:hypothetical protein